MATLDLTRNAQIRREKRENSEREWRRRSKKRKKKRSKIELKKNKGQISNFLLKICQMSDIALNLIDY